MASSMAKPATGSGPAHSMGSCCCFPTSFPPATASPELLRRSSASTASSPRRSSAPPPPRRRGASGYRGIRQRPNGWYSAEIRSGDVGLSLGTFQTSHEAARAYDAAVWRLDRPRQQMNFQDVHTRQQAQDVAPPPRLITDQDRAEHARRQRRLLFAEEDERAMAEWRRRHPEDVANEEAF
nr:ethylene-responsive transcription factor ERF071-like [Aegilops tauschii subsp. strangulata]